MKIRIFTVFHLILDEIIFNNFTNNEIDNWFIKYGVNEVHSKKTIYRKLIRRFFKKNIDENIILEYKLTNYDPKFQDRGFMEGSCYAHVNKNKLYENMDYIGVCQYDMRWTTESVMLLRNLASQDNIDKKNAWGVSVGNIMSPDKVFHEYAFPESFDWNFMLNNYNQYFNKDWNIDILINKPFSLYQTYILPIHLFEQLSNWLIKLMDDLYPWGNQAPYGTHWGYLGGWIERAESLFIATRIHENELIFNHLPIDHDESIPKNLKIEKKHYV